MRETITCMQCNEPFTIFRSFKNRNADIRFCDSCKAEINYYEQNERTAMRVVTDRPARGGRRAHLATN